MKKLLPLFLLPLLLAATTQPATQEAPKSLIALLHMMPTALLVKGGEPERTTELRQEWIKKNLIGRSVWVQFKVTGSEAAKTTGLLPGFGGVMVIFDGFPSRPVFAGDTIKVRGTVAEVERFQGPDGKAGILVRVGGASLVQNHPID